MEFCRGAGCPTKCSTISDLGGEKSFADADAKLSRSRITPDKVNDLAIAAKSFTTSEQTCCEGWLGECQVRHSCPPGPIGHPRRRTFAG